eukprot:51806_1
MSGRFDKNVHVKFYEMHLKILRMEYQVLDPNRMTLIYFVVSALDILGALDKVPRNDVVEWIYAQQVLSNERYGDTKCGFRAGPSLGVPYQCEKDHPLLGSKFDGGHLAMTYTALSTLVILGDDLSRVDKTGVIGSLRHLQLENGSFRPLYAESESDMRFIYCAAAISWMLGDFSGLNIDKMADYIASCQTYDGAFGMCPGNEGHGGSTFCAVAALALIDRLDRIPDTGALSRWCLTRQGSGYSGRPGKPSDTCYSFWIGGTIKLLGLHDHTCPKRNRTFNLRCQLQFGGFSKVPDAIPDLLHSYMGLCGLSLMDMDGLGPVNAALGFSQRAVDELEARRSVLM